MEMYFEETKIVLCVLACRFYKKHEPHNSTYQRHSYSSGCVLHLACFIFNKTIIFNRTFFFLFIMFDNKAQKLVQSLRFPFATTRFTTRVILKLNKNKKFNENIRIISRLYVRL